MILVGMKHDLFAYRTSTLILSLFLSSGHALNSNKRPIFRLRSMKRMNSNNKISKDKFACDHNDWLNFRKNSKFVVDKTRVIESIERSGVHLDFCRPQGFGKSLLCSQLKLYYDINTTDEQVSEKLSLNFFML